MKSEADSTPAAASPDALSGGPAAVGAHVNVTKGAWTGVVGVIDKLTTSVGGGRTSVVRVDSPADGTKDARFIPRSRLVVVENEHLTLADPVSDKGSSS